MSEERLCFSCEDDEAKFYTLHENFGLCEYCDFFLEKEKKGELLMRKIELEEYKENMAEKGNIELFEKYTNQEPLAKHDHPTEHTLKLNIKPVEVKAHLDKFIVGQEKAKKKLSIALYSHIKRIQHNIMSNFEGDNLKIEKSNVLLLGPSGSGKTALVKALAAYSILPVAYGDATELTAAGYVGSDIDTLLAKLVSAANDDINLAQCGIVFIDEIDKIGRKSENPSITRDVSGEDVQQGLLKMLEGDKIDITMQDRKHPGAPTTTIDTSNILFICAGSFAGIENQITTKTGSNNGIGFSAELNTKKEESFDYADLTTNDLAKFGMIPELLGRLPILAPLEKLSKLALRKILTEPDNSILKQYQKLLQLEGKTLTFTDKQLDSYAQRAIETGLGARALRQVIENTLEDILFYGPSTQLSQIELGKTNLKKAYEQALLSS